MNDGGPAFPCKIDKNSGTYGDRRGVENVPGMTLRDWFAGQALAGLSARFGSTSFERMAEDCYQQANAMLKAREEGEGR